MDRPAFVEVDTGAATTLYLAPAEIDWEIALSSGLGQLIRHLDQMQICMVGSTTPALACDESHISNIMRTCTGLVAVSQDCVNGARSGQLPMELHIASRLGLPKISIQIAGQGTHGYAPDSDVFTYDIHSGGILSPSGKGLDDFLCATSQRSQSNPYAFLAVRIHDDFEFVRSAIRSAIENTLGIPCVWFDDPRIVTSVTGVRERTQLLIKNAALVIADLTFGPDNPNHDSPNTAHEIGMALAYDRTVIVTCQNPRRDLYFSAGDLQILFWNDEQHLNLQLTDWLRVRRRALGRRVFNFELAAIEDSYQPRITAASFNMDWERRYLAPNRAHQRKVHYP